MIRYKAVPPDMKELTLKEIKKRGFKISGEKVLNQDFITVENERYSVSVGRTVCMVSKEKK